MASPNVAESSNSELLDAQAHVWNHILNYINSMSLKCAIQLGIPDAIHKHGKPMTLSQLAHALSINKANSNALFRLMRILVHSKFFDMVKSLSDEEEAYCLTLASRLLLRDNPWSMAPFALSMLDPSLVDLFHHTSEWFVNECPSPFVFKHGKTLWEYAGTEQGWNALFNESMANDGRLVSTILVQENRKVFEGLKTMVDVGGGTGMVAKAIADAFPGLKSIVLDLPHVVSGLQGFDNLRYVSGDMFQKVPDADAVFLKWILHDWSDEECIKILEKCKEAISVSKNINGGKVIIIDMILDDKKQEDATVETQLLFDILMMTWVTGKERTEKEWANIFFAAGFKTYKIYPLLKTEISIVLELPRVASSLKRSENLRYVSGDIFNNIPHVDAVFRKFILHNWNDEACVKILEKCKEAITVSKNINDGKVTIVDMVLDEKKLEDETTETQLLLDMLMMTAFSGKERTQKEWANLFFAAGFKTYKIYPLLGLRSVIEVFPSS